MDIIDIKSARRFSAEKASRLGLMQRPRLVCDLVCLEPGQQESRRDNSTSDELYYVIEGRAMVRIGKQEVEVEAEQAVLVPPQVQHWIANPGPGRLTALAIVTPQPGREAEVRPPRETGPRGAFRRPEGERQRPAGGGRFPGAERGEERRPRPGGPPREREREGTPERRGPSRGPGPRGFGAGPRRPSPGAARPGPPRGRPPAGGPRRPRAEGPQADGRPPRGPAGAGGRAPRAGGPTRRAPGGRPGGRPGGPGGGRPRGGPASGRRPGRPPGPRSPRGPS